MSTVTLSKPLKTHAGEVTEITLNEPTARCFVRYGEPFKVRSVGNQGEIEYFNKEMLGFLTEMTGIDSILLEGLPAKDYYALRNAAAAMLLGVAENPTEK